MAKTGLSLVEAAASLGVSPRTIRRFIKAGKLRAELVPGQFGQEYRIFDLPPGPHRPGPVDKGPGQSLVKAPAQVPAPFMDLIRELQEKNLALAAQLGAATERVRHLEGQVKLLGEARRPWWKRLLARKVRG